MHKPIVTTYISRFGVVTLLGSLALSGCGGGGGGGGDTSASAISISGSVVDGPMARATVSLYRITVDAATGDIAVSTTAVGSGTTDDQGNIQGISMPDASAAPYLMKIEAVAGDTVDLNTCTVPGDTTTANCSAPVMAKLKTVVTADTINAGNPIYATPLTTLVSDLAINYANADASLTLDGFVNTYLPKAGRDIASSFGMGIDSSIDILTTPPIIDANTDTAEEQQATAKYRAAVAATVALLEQMSAQTVDSNVDNLVVDLMDDLADGVIDGNASGAPVGNYTSEAVKVLTQDPSQLTVPGTSYTVSQVAQMLVDEQAATGSTTDTSSTNLAATTVDPIPVETNPDIDGDGTVNSEDAFPENAAEQSDYDGDGIGDNADTDDDNDGVLDVDDAYPLDATRWTTATATSTDSDADGVADSSDNCPLIYNPNQTDTDTDSVGDACDSDDDNDGVADSSDAFPLDNTEDTDTDGDGIGNNTDIDDDNDGLADSVETNTGIYVNASDTGTNPLLVDTDGDGWNDGTDEAPTDNTVWYNTPPVARDDVATLDEDTTATITLSANDTDADGSIASFNIPATTSGSVSLTDNGNGTVDFTPPANWNGSDSFSYTVTDNDGKTSNTATVTINVTPVNDAPVGVADSASTSEDMPVTTGNVLTNDTDVDGDTLSVTAVDTSSANGGTVVNNNEGTFTYTPALNWNGTDSFNYTVSDGALTATATVTVSVSPVNDAPVAVIDMANTSEDTPVTTVNVLINDTDVDGDSLSVVAADTSTLNAGTVVNNGDGTFTYTPALNWNGADSFGYTVSDGLLTSTGTVTVSVSAVNDAPVANGNSLITDEDVPIFGTLSGSDVDGDSLSYILVTTGNNGVASITNAATGAFNYTPGHNFNGSDSFTFVVNDGTVDSAAATITITINPVNDAPDAYSGSLSATEDTAANGTLTGADVDLDAVTFILASNGSKGSVVINDVVTGAYTYTPNANASGSDSFTFVTNDGTLDSTPATVSVTITPVNDAPTAASATITATINTQSAGVTPDVTDVDLANEGDSYTFAIASQATNGTASIVGNQLVYTPNADYTGTDSFTFTATDSGGLSVTGTANVDVIAGTGALWGSFNWDSAVWQ